MFVNMYRVKNIRKLTLADPGGGGLRTRPRTYYFLMLQTLIFLLFSNASLVIHFKQNGNSYIANMLKN